MHLVLVFVSAEVLKLWELVNVAQPGADYSRDWLRMAPGDLGYPGGMLMIGFDHQRPKTTKLLLNALPLISSMVAERKNRGVIRDGGPRFRNTLIGPSRGLIVGGRPRLRLECLVLGVVRRVFGGSSRSLLD